MIVLDSEIKQLLLEGSPREQREAAQWLAQKYGEQLYGQVRPLVKDHATADAIVRKTFIRAWDNLESSMGYPKLSAWLYCIAMDETKPFADSSASISIKLKNVPDLDRCETLIQPDDIPEAYFESLPEQIASALPSKTEASEPQQEVTAWMKIKPYVYMAIAFAALFYGLSLFV